MIVKIVKLLTGRVDHGKTHTVKAVYTANAAVIAAMLTAAAAIPHRTSADLWLGGIYRIRISHRISLVVHCISPFCILS